MTDVKIVKLMNGQEVVAKVTENKGVVTIESPMVFVQAREGLGLIPFMPFAKDEKFTLKSEHVLCIATPEEEIEQGYRQQTSGLVMASASDVAGLKLST